MTLKHSDAESEQLFESAIRLRRTNAPDPSVTDAVDCLESLGRLERAVMLLKERACRGDDGSAVELVLLKAALYDLYVETVEEQK